MSVQRLHPRRHRIVQVEVLGRNRRLEPLLVQRIGAAGGHQVGDHVVDDLLEGRVVLAHHARVGFGLQRGAGHDPVGLVLGLGALAVEQRLVHHEGDGAARLQRQERLAVVLGEDQVHLVGVLRLAVHFLQDAVFGGAGGGDHSLALQVREVLDAGVLLHQHQHAVDEDVVGERHLLLTFQVVGGGAALEVDGAVLQQRDPVLRGDRCELDLQAGQAERLLHPVDDQVGDLLRVAGDVAAAGLVRERDRRFAVADGDHARLLDLRQGVVRLRLRAGRQHRQGAGRGHRQAAQRAPGRVQGLHGSPPFRDVRVRTTSPRNTWIHPRPGA